MTFVYADILLKTLYCNFIKRVDIRLRDPITVFCASLSLNWGLVAVFLLSKVTRNT